MSAEPFSYKSAPVYGGSGGGADKGGKNNFKGFKLYSKVLNIFRLIVYS